MVKKCLNRIKLHPIQFACWFSKELWRFWDLIILLASQHVSWPPWHACWQKTQDSLVRDRKHFTTQGTANSINISIFLGPPWLPSPSGAIQWVQIDAAQAVGLVPSWGTQGQVIFEQAANIRANNQKSRSLLYWRASSYMVITLWWTWPTLLLMWLARKTAQYQEMNELCSPAPSVKNMQGGSEPWQAGS